MLSTENRIYYCLAQALHGFFFLLRDIHLNATKRDTKLHQKNNLYTEVKQEVKELEAM